MFKPFGMSFIGTFVPFRIAVRSDTSVILERFSYDSSVLSHNIPDGVA